MTSFLPAPLRLVLSLLLIALMLGACESAPTYDRDKPAASMEAMSTELSPEKRQEFVQAVGVLVGGALFQGMSGGSVESDADVNKRLDKMDGMTADEIIAYAQEVRSAERSP